MVSPYLLRPLRTESEVRREREEQGRTAQGTWLPWDTDQEGPMYEETAQIERAFADDKP